MRLKMFTLSAALLGLTVAFASPTFAQATAGASTPVPATSAPVNAVAGKTFNEADKAAIEDIIENYLTKEHPEVLMTAMKELQRREQASADAKTSDAIKSEKAKIYNDPATPVGGNPKGSINVVEFFDYQCGYCKMSETSVEKLLKDDKDVRFIYKEFPILGPMSVTATKAAFAASKQGNDKYIKFHDALMAKKDHLTEDMIYAVAKDAGLDVDKVKKDMASDEVAKMIQTNLDLGAAVGVRGTPMFIIGDQVYPGALEYDQLKKAVEDARTAAKK